MATLTNYLTYVRERLGVPSSDAMFTDTNVTNAVNQAIRRGPPSRISISVAARNDGTMEAVIADDGAGERRRTISCLSRRRLRGSRTGTDCGRRTLRFVPRRISRIRSSSGTSNGNRILSRGRISRGYPASLMGP